MFDTFKPFLQLEHQPFAFYSNRYEIWIGGQMTNSGVSDVTIEAQVTESPNDNEDCTLIKVIDFPKPQELISENLFDVLVTSNDRYSLITIPENGNNNECMGIVMYKSILGATRRSKTFLKNEPYCCNLFFQDSSIVKVAFAFNAPEKMIEFYM